MEKDRVIAPYQETAKRKLPWGRIVRPVVSAGLLFLLLRNFDWAEFLGLIKKADPAFLVLSLALVLVAILLSAYKWQRLLVVQNVYVPLPRLFVFYLVGLFFNNFLPTNIGGDVVRMHDTARYTGKTPEAVSSVVSERLLAAFALALTAAAGLLLSYRMSSRFGSMVAGVFVFTLLLVLFFTNEKWRRALERVIKLPDKFAIRERLNSFGTSMGVCLRDQKNTVYVVLLSILFHIIVVAISYFIFQSLGLNIAFMYCLLFIPIISAIQMLPISISGFGVREGAYVYFFAGVGLSNTQAIASSLIFWGLVAFVSLSGGIIFALRK